MDTDTKQICDRSNVADYVGAFRWEINEYFRRVMKYDGQEIHQFKNSIHTIQMFLIPSNQLNQLFKTKTTGCGHPLPSHIIKSFKVKLFDNVKFTLCTIAIDRYGLKITKKHWIKMYESMTSNEYNYKSQEMVV